MSRLTISVPDSIESLAQELLTMTNKTTVSAVFSDALKWYGEYIKYQEYLKVEIQKGLDDYEQNGTVDIKVDEIVARAKKRLKQN